MAFPTTAVLDNFDRANTGPPPSASWGLLATGFGGIQVISNQASTDSAASGVECGAYYNVAQYGPDVEAWITILNVPAGDSSASRGLEARLSSPGGGARNGYHLDWSQDGTMAWYKLVSGGYTQIGTGTTTTMTAGYKLGIELIGTSLKAYVHNGTSWSNVLTVTDSTYTGSGYIGLHCYKATTAALTFDDFGGGTVVTAANSLIVPRKTWRGYR